MNKGLLRLLSGFSDDDWTMFEKFLASPFFVNARSYKKLLVIIKNNKKNFPALTHEYINKQLGEKLNKTTLNTRFSELYKHAIKFLYHVDAEKNMPVYYNTLLKSMADRKLYKNAVKLYSQVKDIFIPKSFYDYNDYLKHLQTLTGINRRVNDLEGFYGCFEQYLNYSSVFALYSIITSAYDSATLDHKVMAVSRDKFLKLFKLVNYEEINKLFGDNSLFKPVIQVYHILNAYLNDNDETFFTEAFSYFKKNFNDYSDQWKEELYLNLQSICVDSIQKGNTKYYFHYFDIIKHKINNNQPVITEYSHYGFSEFHDIVNVALACKEYQWTERFINKFSSKLNPETREIEINLAFAAIYDAKKDYLKVFDIVTRHKRIKNKFLNIEIHIYKAAACFELEYFDELDRALKNIKKITQKHFKLNPFYFDKVKMFALNTEKLKNAVAKPKKKAEELIYLITKQNTHFPMKNWVLQKAKEML